MKAMGTLILLGLSIMGCSTAAEKPVVVQPARYTLSLNALPRVDASKPLQFKASLIPLAKACPSSCSALTQGYEIHSNSQLLPVHSVETRASGASAISDA